MSSTAIQPIGARPAPKSRALLLRAFAELVQTRRYDDIKVSDIIRRANISRSTFYEHFRGKDDLLSSSIAGPFARLARCAMPGPEKHELLELLEHFWANRASARALLQTPLRRKIAAVLVAQIERLLKSRTNAMTGSAMIPQRLLAIQIAEVLLAPISAWLTGESRCSAQMLARALPRAANALLAAAYSK
jgi:AcrR family transcriptional regulator